MTATAELVRRLRGLADSGYRRSVGYSEAGAVKDGEPVMVLRNPDGPEAATTIETLAAALAEAEEARDAAIRRKVVAMQDRDAEEARADAAEAERDRYKAALESVIDAANSFCDESGDDVAAQVKIRAAQALSRDGGGDGAS